MQSRPARIISSCFDRHLRANHSDPLASVSGQLISRRINKSRLLSDKKWGSAHIGIILHACNPRGGKFQSEREKTPEGQVHNTTRTHSRLNIHAACFCFYDEPLLGFDVGAEEIMLALYSLSVLHTRQSASSRVCVCTGAAGVWERAAAFPHFGGGVASEAAAHRQRRHAERPVGPPCWPRKDPTTCTRLFLGRSDTKR